MKEFLETRGKIIGIIHGKNSARWIEWIHEGNLPAETQEMRKFYAETPDPKHCEKCKNINGDWFSSKKMPELPLHPGCHCEIKDTPQPIPGETAFAECPIEKIEKWAFVDKAKKRFFEGNGYDIMDSEIMQAHYEQQAVEKYAYGDYELGVLDKYGQRITIAIELPRRVGNDTEPLTYDTGWMVYPFGKIKCTTSATNLSLE